MHPRVRILVSAAALAAAPVAPVTAQDHEHRGDPGQLGQVVFPTTCNAAAQARFETAVAMLHSFWFEQAVPAFEAVAAADPGCAMAHWGLAMTFLTNPMTRTAPPPVLFERGLEALSRAEQLAAGASERERMWIAAAEAAYRDHETKGHLERMLAHEAAFAALRVAYPEDLEASIFYARTLVANSPPTDMTFARNLRAAEILDPLFERYPDHPGLAHYIIHAYDAPPIAARGLDAARRYAAIAPAAPHALHMPSHIFTRVGEWDASIETNARSAAVETPAQRVHPEDYMVYAYLQQGRDREAAALVERAVAQPDRFYGGLIGYNAAAMPARHALERDDWTAAARLPLPAGALPYVEAITRFARAVGAARSGQPDLAAAEVEALAGLEEAVRRAGGEDWVARVGAQRLAAAAWLAHARGDAAGALRLARDAAGLEDTVEKHPVTPGPLLPARELYGDLLLELGRPADALAAYEATLEREPNRGRTFLGAARAAEAAGDAARARAHYAALLHLMERADPERPGPHAARAFLGDRRRH